MGSSTYRSNYGSRGSLAHPDPPLLSGMMCVMRLLILTPIICRLAAAACSPIPGDDALWSRPSLRYVIVGEMHGSAETPAIFADLICAAQASGRTVIVGIEHIPAEQDAIDAFLHATGHDEARSNLLSLKGWQGTDGRASRAMFGLLESLRGMRVEVLAFDAGFGLGNAERNRAMADALQATAHRHAEALIIALTGNIHGSKKLFAGYAPMAMLLPAAETVSLFVVDRGGQVWASIDGVDGPHDLKSSGGNKRGVDLTPTRAYVGGYDGVLSTGLPSTASPPLSIR